MVQGDILAGADSLCGFDHNVFDVLPHDLLVVVQAVARAVIEDVRGTRHNLEYRIVEFDDGREVGVPLITFLRVADRVAILAPFRVFLRRKAQKASVQGVSYLRWEEVIVFVVAVGYGADMTGVVGGVLLEGGKIGGLVLEDSE